MKKLLLPAFLFLLLSCGNAPFVKHELKFEKKGGCGPFDPSVRMLSNINGERYELDACMDDDFDGKNYQLSRHGDSLLVSFPKSASKKQALFHLTMDIDANPAYHYISLDGRSVTVVPFQ